MEGDLAHPNGVVIRYEAPWSPKLPGEAICNKIAEIFKVDPDRVRVRFGGSGSHALVIDAAYKSERRFGDRPHQVDSLQAFIAAREPAMANCQLQFREIDKIPSAPSGDPPAASSGGPDEPRKNNTSRNRGGFPDDRRAVGHGHPGLTRAGEPHRRPSVGRGAAAPGSAWPAPLAATNGGR